VGESVKALEYYSKSLSVNRSAEILSNVGLLYVHMAQFQKALNSFHESFQLYKSHGDKGGQALVFNNVGLSYLTLGDLDSALDSFTKSLALTRLVRYKYGEAVVLRNIGKVYSAKGQIEKSLPYFNRALALDQEMNDRSGQGVVLTTIAETYSISGDLRKSFDYYDRALPILRATGDRRHETAALIHMGKAYEQSHETARGMECYKDALSLAQNTEDPFSQAAAMYGIAHVQRDRGNLADGLAEIESAIKIVENLRSSVSDQQLRTTYSSSVREYYELYIDLLMQLEKQDPTKGYAAKGLEVSEHATARSLLETLHEARAEIRRGADPHLLEREHSLQQLLDGKTDRQIRLLGGEHTASQVATVRKEMQELLSEYQDVEAQIRASSPGYAALTQPQPFSLAEIQKQVLDADTLLLEYSLGSERSYLWAVTPDSLASFQLPKGAQVEAAARRVYELLTARNRIEKGGPVLQKTARLKRAEFEYKAASAALSEMVLGPVAKLINGKRLVIVADGALQYVPFGVLPSPRGEGSRSGSAPLIFDNEIVYLPSASVLGLSRRDSPSRRSAPKAVAVLADAVFDPGDARVKSTGHNLVQQGHSPPHSNPGSTPWPASLTESSLIRSVAEVGARGEGHHLSRLAFSRQEAESIFAVTPAEQGLQALDFDASRATATSAELSQYRMIHFATHGLLDSEHPELSGLVLSLVDKRGRSVNGFLDLEDVYNLNLSADRVTLSACETGLGKEVKGEGLVGMTRGFMYAGARQVVASLWKVDDAATAELMGRFYKGMLQEGLRPAAALRRAQVEMRKQRQWADPYNWGAFTIQGEWR
jgi:CHAT domain-containing protein